MGDQNSDHRVNKNYNKFVCFMVGVHKSSKNVGHLKILGTRLRARSHHTKFSYHGNLTPGICALQVYTCFFSVHINNLLCSCHILEYM
jgi:hypothetical protein